MNRVLVPVLAQEGCVGHLLQTCRGWGLKKRAPGATGAPVHRPDREFGAAVGAAAEDESGLQRGHHAQLCRAALFPREQAQRLRCSIARLVANLIRPCQSYAAAFRTPFRAFPYPLGMRSGLVDDLAGESGDSHPRMWL